MSGFAWTRNTRTGRTSEIHVTERKVDHQVGSPPDQGHDNGENSGGEQPEVHESVESEEASGDHVFESARRLLTGKRREVNVSIDTIVPLCRTHWRGSRCVV